MTRTAAPRSAVGREPRPTAEDAEPTKSAEPLKNAEPPKNIVTVDRRDGWLAEVPTFRRAGLSLTHVHKAAHAIALCRRLRRDLVVLVYPIPDMHLDEFVLSLREGRSPSSQPHIVVIAHDRDLRRLDGYADESLTLLSANRPLEEIEAFLMELVDEPRRVATRLIARFKTKLKNGDVLRICQTVDLSRTGVLVKCKKLLPIGARVELEITLDGDTRPTRMEAEVVRHALEAHVGRGMGLRFTNLEEEAEARLLEYLSRPYVRL